MINKFRCSGYDGDGVYVYECLSCYRSLGVQCSGPVFNFCPNCGIKFEGFFEEKEKKYYPLSDEQRLGRLEVFEFFLEMRDEQELTRWDEVRMVNDISGRHLRTCSTNPLDLAGVRRRYQEKLDLEKKEHQEMCKEYDFDLVHNPWKLRISKRKV